MYALLKRTQPRTHSGAVELIITFVVLRDVMQTLLPDVCRINIFETSTICFQNLYVGYFSKPYTSAIC